MVKTTRLNVAPVMRLKSDDAKDKRIIELETALGEQRNKVSELVTKMAEAQDGYEQRFQEFEIQIGRTNMARDKAQDAAFKAEKAEAEARGQFADLKRRLHEAELANARLKGYLDRVVEDDTAREEPRVITEQRMMPRRPPPLQRGEFDTVDSRSMCATDGYGRPKHWTGY
ncbi:hypothetical protein KHC23_07655 [Ancylobacter dichloromethanicus]|uniref:Uncharacterized protein n=1 Tax=Ancylobacter dichloromethanicus TaxID=518825 RepID=A0A9W6MZC9_9HYPH|nr:hypothetical protein [Ancylobacter dichloromethanicus]MBS7553521.1 hypothetical protein [Ancylobacter dichloromethanicus]GLK72579.1 hypothetical protein GCM10017643_26950 [Ancylobacter dichloromethanicus]